MGDGSATGSSGGASDGVSPGSGAAAGGEGACSFGAPVCVGGVEQARVVHTARPKRRHFRTGP